MPVGVRVAEPDMDGVEVTEVADGVFRLALPLGIHGVPTVSAYLLRGDDGAIRIGAQTSIQDGTIVHTTLRRALRDAVADGLVVRNVAAQARPPRARRSLPRCSARRSGRPRPGHS